MDKKRLVLACAVITLVAICIITAVIFAMSHQPSSGGTQPTPLTATGTLACLPHKNASSGQPQTLECAIGLKTDDGRYYGLTDLPKNADMTPFTKHITVSGDVTPPAANASYDTRGDIKVKDFKIN
jgi:hypothetical protein